MSDPLDLDGIEGRARALVYALGRDHIGAVASFGQTVGDQDVPALVAEVRRLRDPDVMLAALVESGRLVAEITQEGDASTVVTTLHYRGSRLIDQRHA